MKKIILIGLFIFLFISALYVFFKSEPKIKIGVIISKDSVAGYEEIRAIEYYFKKNTNNKTELLFMSPELEKKDYQNKLKQLIELKTDILLNGALSVETGYIFDIINRDNIPTIGITTSNNIYSGKKDNFYRFIPSTSLMAEAAAKHMEKKNIKNICFISSKINPPYSKSFLSILKKKFNGTIKEYDYSENMKVDFYHKYDLYYLFTSPEESIPLLMQFAKNNQKPEIYLSNWAFDTLLRNYKADYLEGLYIVTEVNFDYKDKEMNKLAEDFGEEYNVSPSWMTYITFFTCKVLNEAINSGNFRKYLKKEHNFTNTIFNNLYYNEYGDVIPQFYNVYKYEKGKIILAEKILNSEYKGE